MPFIRSEDTEKSDVTSAIWDRDNFQGNSPKGEFCNLEELCFLYWTTWKEDFGRD